MKKSGKKARKSQQTEEQKIRAEKMEFWDAILAKSHTENPVTESSKEPLNVRENRTVVYVPSQDKPLGSDNDEFESNRALTAYVSPAHTGNTLIPTATLEVMCKQASIGSFDTYTIDACTTTTDVYPHDSTHPAAAEKQQATKEDVRNHAQIPVNESHNKALTVYVPPPHSSNTLTSKLMKEDNGSVQKDDTVQEMENAVTVYDAVPLLVVQPPPVTGATGQVVDALPHAAETTKNYINSAFGKIGFATKWDEEHPKSECTHNRKPLSIHDKLKQYAGYEREPHVFFLGDIFNESLEGNALTPTHQLESMCNEASKVIKLPGQSNWNLNAQPFTPNDIPPQGRVVATEKAQPNDVATESAPVQPKRVQPSRSSRSKPYRGKG